MGPLVERVAHEADAFEPAAVGAHPATEQLDDRVVELLVDGGIRSVDERVDLAERRRFADRLVRRRVAPVDEQTAARVRDDRADPAEEVGPERVVGEVVAAEHEGDLATLAVRCRDARKRLGARIDPDDVVVAVVSTPKHALDGGTRLAVVIDEDDQWRRGRVRRDRGAAGRGWRDVSAMSRKASVSCRSSWSGR